MNIFIRLSLMIISMVSLAPTREPPLYTVLLDEQEHIKQVTVIFVQ